MDTDGWQVLAREAGRRRSTRQTDASRRQRSIDDFALRRRDIDGIQNRTERAEHNRELRAVQEHAAEAFGGEARAEQDRLTGALRAAASEPPRDLTYFLRTMTLDEPPTLVHVAGPPRPEWSKYAPDAPGLFGRRRHEKAVIAARARLDHDLAAYDQARHAALDELISDFEVTSKERRHAHEKLWDAVARKIVASDPAAISDLAGAVVGESTTLRGLLDGGRATYVADPRELVLEIDLPDGDVVPPEVGWRYVIGRRTIEAIAWRKGEAAMVYAAFVGQVVLAVLDACFRGMPAAQVDVISINGHVHRVDPATGREIHPCVVTVTTDRETFTELELLSPELAADACLRHLGAELSHHPYAAEHVMPIVNFDLRDYRIAYGPDPLVQLDHRMDLLAMNPFRFEELVKELFAKMGYDTWRTESRRDEGVDAVAIRSDLHMPVECIVQAKRTHKRVTTQAVQALMGAMAEKPTATHGYLVTTSWLSPNSRLRARALRIHTMERDELATKIKELLGVEVVISNRLPAGRSRATPPQSPPTA